MASKWVVSGRIPDGQCVARLYLIFKEQTGTIVGMWRRQTDRDTVMTGMAKSFPGQYGVGKAFCRCDDAGTLEVEFQPDTLKLPECYAKEFEAMARVAAPER